MKDNLIHAALAFVVVVCASIAGMMFAVLAACTTLTPPPMVVAAPPSNVELSKEPQAPQPAPMSAPMAAPPPPPPTTFHMPILTGAVSTPPVPTSVVSKRKNPDEEKMSMGPGFGIIAMMKTRDYLRKNQNPSIPVYGMVVFTSKPINKEEEERNRYICKAWEATLLTNAEAAVPVNGRTFTTYWPTLGMTGSCIDLHNYDYARVEKILSKLKINKPGPMLVAVFDDNSKQKYAILNLNTLAKEGIEKVFNVWKYELVVTDGGWNSSFNLVYFKEKFKNILNDYGKELLTFKT